MMQEAFLHFIWQFGFFSRDQLYTTAGETIQILHPGYLNKDAGPDFSQARLFIGQLEWAGQVEIHIHSSDWYMHGHQMDEAYDHVVLHVVWKHDRNIYRRDGSLIPALQLSDKISTDLLSRYQNFITNSAEIPCAAQFKEVNPLYKIQSLENALMQRLAMKADIVKGILQQNSNNWEETSYQLLARNMGFKLNSEAFLQLARALPLKLLLKHADQLHQMEAMLFGQAGFLDNPQGDDYYTFLQKEYTFLAHKYDLLPRKLASHLWKFLRLRPANFPSMRITQLAALIQTHRNLFSLFINIESAKTFEKLLQVQPSSYWQEHYIFGKPGKTAAVMGQEGRENILINTVVPLLVCYGKEKGNYTYVERAIHLLEELPAENNHITRIWKKLGLSLTHAYDGQGSIELYNHFCMQKKCLSCPVGLSILKPASTKQIH